MRIAVVGGTGREGRGLALRWARKGHEIAIGSRDRQRAEERARELGSAETGSKIAGGDNRWAIAEAEVVVVSVPYCAHDETLRQLAPLLAGRTVVDITVPLRPPAVNRVHLPVGLAAALEAQTILGADTPVVAALHHVSSTQLADPEAMLDGDVLVCSDHDGARATAMALIGDLGARALDAGPLCNAIALEAMTPVLIHLNKRYGGSCAGIRFVGFG
jgi:NADPH-dependent F420 reductase